MLLYLTCTAEDDEGYKVKTYFIEAENATGIVELMVKAINEAQEVFGKAAVITTSWYPNRKEPDTMLLFKRES